MKKYLLVLVLGCMLTNTYAQEVFPETGVWRTDEITFSGLRTSYYGLCGDTIIGNRSYRKFNHLVDYPNGTDITESYQGAIRIEGDTVWVHFPWMGEETILFDFSLHLGSVIYLDAITGPISMVVEAVGSTTIDGQELRTITFMPEPISGFKEVWIEGIGSNRGIHTRGLTPGADVDVVLECFTNNAIDYINTDVNPDIDCPFINNPSYCDLINSITTPPNPLDAFKIFPNPTTGAVQLKIPQEVFSNYSSLSYSIFDARGQRLQVGNVAQATTSISVLHDQPAGMYWIKLEATSTAAQESMVKKVVKN